jgi:hypothetical protein
MKLFGKPSADPRKPVSRIVSEILEHGRKQHVDGPASGLFGRDAQLSASLTQAGTLLAKLDRGDAPKRSTIFQAILGSLAAPKPKPKRAFFASSTPKAMPDARQIEQLLQATIKDGRRLVLDSDVPESPSETSDVNCVLPVGAKDPVCEPR